MTRCWVIAPYRYSPGMVFDAVWDYSRRNDVISIGWHEVGDLTGASKKEIKDRHQAVYSEINYQSLQRFWHDIEPGDRVIARAGLKRVVGIGTVEGKPFFDLDRGREVTCGLDQNIHPNFLIVHWELFERESPYRIFRGHLNTVTELKETQKHWPAIKAVLQGAWDTP